MADITTLLGGNPAVVAALVSAMVAAVTAVITLIVNPFSQRFVEASKTLLQKDLENYREQISKELSENNSRLSYEFDARKRLYNQVEPFIFQLYESSEQCYYRVANLVRTSREKKLIGEESWLSGERYYMRSTLYFLLAPLAIFRCLQKTTTFVDLRLDELIRIRYFLLKRSFMAFTDDFVFAKHQGPKFFYKPDEGDRDGNLRAAKPQRFWRQGLALGHLDCLTEAMLVEEGNDRRVMSFGEFKKNERRR